MGFFLGFFFNFEQSFLLNDWYLICMFCLLFLIFQCLVFFWFSPYCLVCIIFSLFFPSPGTKQNPF